MTLVCEINANFFAESWQKSKKICDHNIEPRVIGANYVKNIRQMAFATVLLAWGEIAYESSYESANLTSQLHETIRWATDFFINAYKDSKFLYTQVIGLYT
jgi:hypothetical protein